MASSDNQNNKERFLSEEELVYLGIGVGIGIGIIAVATAPAWLPAAKAKALQVALVKSVKMAAIAATC